MKTFDKFFVGITFYKGKVFLPTLDKICGSYYVQTDPVYIEEIDREIIIKRIGLMKAKGHLIIEKEEEDSKRPAILKATKTRSWKSLVNNSYHYSIGWTKEKFYFNTSTRARFGWNYKPGQTFPLDTPLGKIVDLILEDYYQKKKEEENQQTSDNK